MNPLNNIPQKGFYYHYKHDPQGDFNNYAYEVVGIGRNTEEGGDIEYTVLYRPLYKNDWMAPADYQSRPFLMFIENVNKDGKDMPRFRLIQDVELVVRLNVVKAEMYSK